MPPPLTFTNTVRYSTLALCVLAFVLSLFALIAFGRGLPAPRPPFRSHCRCPHP